MLKDAIELTVVLTAIVSLYLRLTKKTQKND